MQVMSKTPFEQDLTDADKGLNRVLSEGRIPAYHRHERKTLIG
jgi:hypothetical protein